MYKVVKSFIDLQDENHVYKVGDVYPRDGKKVSLSRQTELLGDKNKLGRPLIEEVAAEDKEKPKKTKNK